MTMIKGDLERIAESPAEIMGNNYKLASNMLLESFYFIGHKVRDFFADYVKIWTEP